MRRRKVLFIFENSGKSPTFTVRGEIYKDLLHQNHFDVKFHSYRFAQPTSLDHTENRIVQLLISSLGYKMFLLAICKTLTLIYTFRMLWICKYFDYIIFIKVSSFSFIEKVKKRSKAKLIYDQCDALWLPHFSTLFKDIRKILPIVDSVTWDYKYTKEFVQKYNKNIYHWSAASQVELFDKYRDKSRLLIDKEKIIIGWIGSESSAYNLFSIWEALECIFLENHNLHLRILGVDTNKSLLPNFENVTYTTLIDYTQTQMITEVLKMDIGLFPLFNVEDSKVRGYLKSLIYMSGETAVIASPIGVVPELIKDGINGMLANSTEEWIEKLGQLIHDHVLRQRLAKAGLETVRRDFSLERSFQDLIKAIDTNNTDDSN